MGVGECGRCGTWLRHYRASTAQPLPAQKGEGCSHHPGSAGLGAETPSLPQLPWEAMLAVGGRAGMVEPQVPISRGWEYHMADKWSEGQVWARGT